MESAVNFEAYLEMKEKLESSEARIQELQSNNAHMRSQLDELCSTVSTCAGCCCFSCTLFFMLLSLMLLNVWIVNSKL